MSLLEWVNWRERWDKAKFKQRAAELDVLRIASEWAEGSTGSMRRVTRLHELEKAVATYQAAKAEALRIYCEEPGDDDE